jgi:hypothetical protein
MISEAEVQGLAELYAVAAETLDPLHVDAEQRRKAFDLEVERLYSKISPEGITFRQFRGKAVQMCVKYLHRELPPDERRARETSIREPFQGT